MNLEDFRECCLRKPFVTEGFPFDQNTMVFKVDGKIFSLTDVNSFDFINLKAEPEKSMDLRERFEGILPGYHMNKKRWNSVYLNSDVPELLIYEMIDDSYQLVFLALSKKRRDELALG